MKRGIPIIGISGLHHSMSFKKQHFPSLDPREYRIAQGFDSAAALVTDVRVAAAAAEERFIRVQGIHVFPVHAIRYCLDMAEMKPKLFWKRTLRKPMEGIFELHPNGLRTEKDLIPCVHSSAPKTQNKDCERSH